MLKPPRPSYSELISQLQSLEQRRSWFSSRMNMQNPLVSQMAFYGMNIQNPFASQMAFYGQQQQRARQFPSRHHGNPQTFTSIGKGFQAQQLGNQNKNKNNSTLSTQQRCPPPPGESCMTPVERELYRNEKCQYCGTMGHIAKICWWIHKKPTQSGELPQAFAALTLDNTIAETDWTSEASNHMTVTHIC